MKENEEIELCHLHSASFWHDDAYLIGNRAGLEAIHQQLGELLSQPEGEWVRECELYCSDGEGFSLIMVRDDTPWYDQTQQRSWNHQLPYSDELARDEHGARPYDLPVVRALTAEHARQQEEARALRAERAGSDSASDD